MTHLKVLHVIPSLHQGDGGPSRFLSELIRQAWPGQVHAHVVTIARSGDVLPSDLTGRVRTFPGMRILPRRFSLRLLVWIWRHSSDYDIAHVHALYSPCNSLAMWVLRKRGLPYIVRPLGTMDPRDMAVHRGWKRAYTWLIEGRNIRGAAALHFTSDTECREALTHGFNGPRFVIPLAVTLPTGPIQRRRSDVATVVYAGRIAAKKGLYELVAALTALHEEGTPFRLLVAGGNSVEPGAVDQFLATLRASRIKGCVEFVGFVKDVSSILARGDVFVLLSEYENFGLAVAEAMASELPVVVSHGVALSPDIRAADAGWVVDASKPLEVVAALRSAILDTETRISKGVNAKQLILRRFSWRTTTEQMYSMYVDCLSGSTTGDHRTCAESPERSAADPD